MAVSVETLSGLERKMTVSVPNEQFEGEIGARIKRLANKVKIDGFRPGKAPLNIVKQRYAEQVRFEAVRDLIQTTLYNALKESNMMPAGTPQVEPNDIEVGKDLVYTVTFEVYPEFEIAELDGDQVKVISSEIKDKDMNKMVENLREQHQEWHEVSRAAATKDKVLIDFEGFIDGKPFEGGQAQGYEIILGSGSMIPGFEEGLIGTKKDKQVEIKVTFPADYGHADLANQEATFKVTVHQVMESKLPELNDDFFVKFNVHEGGLETLKRDLKEQMSRELDRRISAMNRETIFDVLLEKNKFDLPKALVAQEIEHMKHELYHRIFGHEHTEHEKIPDFPTDMFEPQAKRRVHLSLLYSEYVKKHQITVDSAQVDAMIEKLSTAYERPEEIRTWYKSNKENLAQVEAAVKEELVADRIIANATVKPMVMSYEDVMNPKKDDDKDGQ